MADRTSTGLPGTPKAVGVCVEYSAQRERHDQGMPDKLLKVADGENSFSGNNATDAASTDLDNASTFGTSRLALTQSCDIIFTNGLEAP